MGRLLVHPQPGMVRDAVFDPQQPALYRYRLSRIWNPSLPIAAFIMLNPSVANLVAEDTTVYGCIEFAINWGCGGVVVGNAFALIDPKPKGLYTAIKAGIDPIGPKNDAHLMRIHAGSAFTIAAWGAHAKKIMSRHAHLLAMLRAIKPVHVVRVTPITKVPGHPLYVPRSTWPKPYV
ncbi:DUF1643 domain-containing protein [Archangium gephyra]|uniref:DUF1643 domain-containing protein n=1 Tax=Archangium gephyra TaxID=48 RepID=UPI003B7BD1D7